MNDYILINESSNTKQQKKYKCPYCEVRDIKVNLISHVEEEHEEMIPKDYTPARVVFNHINKKESGRCIQCGRETKWNEDRWRYERLCDDKKCQEEYVKQFRERMVNKHGKEHLLNDPEKQKEMLANRRISGNYTFKDGGIRSYCGSYERKLLEFYDKVMNVHSKDIMTPGPVIEYEFEGKTLLWITDIYYLPANLVHDVKDGGSNPNKRQMDVYRAKQDAKESAISKMGKYNYIRLTDNNFQQLLFILAELKERLMNDSEEPVIHINESSYIGGVLPKKNDNDVYVVPYMMNNVFIGAGLTFDRSMSELYIIEDGRIKKTNPIFLKDYDYTLMKFDGEFDESILGKNNIDNTFYFYEALTGKRYLSNDQILFDNNFTEELDLYTEAVIKMDIRKSSLINAVNSDSLLPAIKSETNKLSNYPNLDVLQSIDGYIIYNMTTFESTKAYKNIEDIPNDVIKVLGLTKN